MVDLDTLRQRITPEQRAVVNCLWEGFRDHDRWPSRQEVQARTGEAALRAAQAALGEAVLREGSEDGVPDCRLTFLGVLLADQGRESEALLVRYLEYVRDRVRADPGLEWVASPEVEAALRLAPERSRQLRQLIRLSHWWGGGSGFGQREWTVGIPLDVEDLPATDVSAYVRRHVLAHFLPGTPGLGGRLPLVPAPPPPSPFSFLGDAALARRLAAHWHEAQDVCQVRGWRSCVLLCGGILETTLRAVLEARASRPAAGAPLPALLQAAREAGLLPPALPASPALEEYAALLSPSSSPPVSRADAEAALQAVRACLHRLAPPR